MTDCTCNHFPASLGNVTFEEGVKVGIGTPTPVVPLDVCSPNTAILLRLKVGSGTPIMELAGSANSAPTSGTYHDSSGNPVSWTSHFQASFYKAMNAYYKEIIDELNRRKAQGQAPTDIELYYPAMAQGAAAEPIGRYCDNGRVLPGNLDDGSIGYTHLQQSIELYGRFTWHDYFFSWHAYEGCVANYFPQWLKDDLYVYRFPSRITECGWYPYEGVVLRERRDRDSGAGTYTQYECDDATPAGQFSEGTYPDDLFYFITQSRQGYNPPADGVAIWLLSTLDPEFDPHVAIRDAQRPWYQTFKLWQP